MMETNQIIVAGKLNIKGKDQIKRVYDSNGIAPTLSTMQGGQQQPKVIVAWKFRQIKIDQCPIKLDDGCKQE